MSTRTVVDEILRFHQLHGKQAVPGKVVGEMAILRQVSAAPVCYSAFLGTSVRAGTHVSH